MGLFKSTKGSIISDYFTPLTPVPGFKHGDQTLCDIALYEDHLILTETLSQNTARLDYAQITDVSRELETEIIEKNKSVIGRALAGGLLLGGVGAVVGGVSGVGKKQTKKTKMYFIISYVSSDGSDQFLCFEDSRMYKGGKIAKMLKEFCHLDDKTPKPTEPTSTQL